MHDSLTIHPLKDLPMIQAGDDLSVLTSEALARNDLDLQDGDVLVIAQKIISKSEDCIIKLVDIIPSEKANRLADEVDKDPRLVELILRESSEIVRTAPGVIIVRHRLGIVSANAGIDQSNIDHSDGESALLLPRDPDRSAMRLRRSLEVQSGKRLGVIVSDSMNRPWRLGTIGYAIGSSGISVLDDRRGHKDLFGRQLQVTMTNRADMIASAATLLMGETIEGVPAVLVRGLGDDDDRQRASDSIRPLEEDLFQ